MTSPKENPPETTGSLARDSVGTTLTNVALFLLGIIIWIAIARLLGPQWRGALALVMLAPSIVLKTGTFGFDHGMVVIGGSDKPVLGALARTGVLLGFAVGIIFIGLLAGFMWGFPITFWRLCQEYWLRDQFMIIAVVFPVHLMTMIYDAAIYAEDRIAVRNAKEFLVNAVMLALILFAVFAMHLKLMGVIGAYIVANTVSLLYGWILVRGRIKLDGPPQLPLVRKAVRLGFPIYFAQLANYIMLPVMMVVLSFSLPGSTEENLSRIAFFTMAYQMIDRILPVTRSISFALLPKITSGSDREASELAAKASRHTILASLLMFTLLVIFMHPIVSILLGKRYLSVVGAFTIMAPGGVALSAIGVWAAHLMARQRPYRIAIAGIIGVAAALITAWVGFAYMREGREVLIASLAVVIGTIVNAIILLQAFCKTGNISVSDALIPTISDLAEWKRIPGYVREMVKRRFGKNE